MILGLDIGGANLKAATADRRAVSVPFALWKQPERLPAALGELVEQFPDAEELAVTMTGELCDCFETKLDGVFTILIAVQHASRGRRFRVWSTDGEFVDSKTARRNHLKVASANWHALATFAGRFAPQDGGLLLDIGSTTTDIIPLDDGVPSTCGLTDQDRLSNRELVYVGVRRTPVCAVVNDMTMAELFATTQDVYVIGGYLPEDPTNRDTADGRPLTILDSKARLARMLGGDRETLTDDEITGFAERVHRTVVERITAGISDAYYDQQGLPELRTVIVSGAGAFIAPAIIRKVWDVPPVRVVSLTEELGPAVSACAPAYAVAVLATEQRPGEPRQS